MLLYLINNNTVNVNTVGPQTKENDSLSFLLTSG